MNLCVLTVVHLPLPCVYTHVVCIRRFKSKYHPEEFEKRQEEVRVALRRRCDVFFDLMKQNRLDGVTVDTEQHEALVKLLDAGMFMWFILGTCFQPKTIRNAWYHFHRENQ